MDPWKISRDMTNVLPEIRAEGLAIVERMKYSGRYSRSYLRRVGILPNPWRKPGPGWKAKP